MKCSQFQQWLDQGCVASSPQEQLAYFAHRAQCPGCARLYELDQAWQETLRHVEPLPEERQAFIQAILDRVTEPSSAPLQEEVDKSSSEVFRFHRHWLPVSLAALMMIGLLSGLWLKLQHKPRGPGHAMVATTVTPLPGEVVGQMVRQIHKQWVMQPRSWLDGISKVKLPTDWQAWLADMPDFLPDPAQLIQPETPHDQPKPL